MRKNIDRLVAYIKDIKKIHKIFVCFFCMVLILYIALCFFAKYLETTLTFPWVLVNTKEYTAPDMSIPELKFEEINITARNGDNINGLFIDNNAEKTIYYFHGNGWDLKYFYSEIQYLSDLGYNVMSYDYPWYGKSTGTPYFEDVTAASDDFFNYIAKEKGIIEEDVIVWWFSIWSGVSLEWVKHRDVDAVILVATFASRYDLWRENFWFSLQKLFFRPNTFISKENIILIDEPILMIHGNQDEIISIDQWREVFKNITSQEKYFIELEGWWHNGVISEYGEILKKNIELFLSDKKWNQDVYKISEVEKQSLLNFLKKEREIQQLDLQTDTSLTKFVNNEIHFETLSYIPENLVGVSSEYVYDAKWWASFMTKRANISLQAMWKAFYKEFWKKMTVVSAYRSYAYQAGIKARWCPDNLCAKAGYSEHQSWLWVDFWSASTQAIWQADATLSRYYDWLSKNAHLYGYHNTYQKGLAVDGYEIEPWHWRYLWIDLATYLRDEEITFAEFYKKNQ